MRSWDYTVKRQYRKFETNIPRKEIARPQSKFLHSCFCEQFIYFHDRSAYSAAGKYVDRSWEYIDLSQTWNDVKIGTEASPFLFLGILKSKFLWSVAEWPINIYHTFYTYAFPKFLTVYIVGIFPVLNMICMYLYLHVKIVFSYIVLWYCTYIVHCTVCSWHLHFCTVLCTTLYRFSR